MEAELRQFMHEYCAAFKPGAVGRSCILDYYHAPLAMTFADQMTVLDSREAVAGTIGTMLDRIAAVVARGVDAVWEPLRR